MASVANPATSRNAEAQPAPTMESPPDSFICPIFQTRMTYPVMTSAGQTYEYAAIKQWLEKGNTTDPMTNKELKANVLTQNHALRSMIQEWCDIEANKAVAEQWPAHPDVVRPPSDEVTVTTVGDKDESSSHGAGWMKAAGQLWNKIKTQNVPADASTDASIDTSTDASTDARLTNEASLGMIVQYKGTSPKPTRSQLNQAVPPPVTTGGITYEFGRDTDGSADASQPGRLIVRIAGAGDDGWVPVPAGASSVFATPQGLVFYDPNHVHDALVDVVNDEEGGPDVSAPGAFAGEKCKFHNRCTNATCKFAHPFACRYGVTCRSLPAGSTTKCKFLHPDPSTVVAVGKSGPTATQCKYGTNCGLKRCIFAHPLGRLGQLEKTQAPVLATHAPDLSLLADGPVDIRIGKRPAGATKFQFQGEFVFFYRPYPGTWAKEHYQTVTMHRFDADQTQTYVVVGEYSLDGHYCNTAVGNGGYFALSWWPYEDEAMRAIYEAGRQLRSQGKQVKAAEAQVRELEEKLRATEKRGKTHSSKLAAQGKRIKGLEAAAETAKAKAQAEKQRKAEAYAARQAAYAARRQEKADAYAAKQAAYKATKERKAREYAERKAQQAQMRAARQEKERQWRAERQRAARARSERYRMRDPIHVYALEAGKNGSDASDWCMILDYHKGAHALEILPPGPVEAGVAEESSMVQRLRVTEHKQVFDFDLVAPVHDLGSVGKLPIVPGRLCADF